MVISIGDNECRFEKYSVSVYNVNRNVNDFILIRYRPGSIPVDHVQGQLGYSSKDQESWNTFIEPFNLSFTDPERSKIDCKASASSIPLIK